MKSRALFLARLFLFAALPSAGCQHPDGQKEARATQSAITRASDATAAADQANAKAQAALDDSRKAVDAAQAAVQDIDAKTRTLLQSP